MAEPDSSWTMTVAMDYGQYSLAGAADDDDDLDEFEAPLKALELAQDGDGIGRVGNVVVVLSPHQNNFEMQVAWERWSSAPPDDLDRWDEVFEVSLRIDEQGLTYDSPTMEGETVALAPGLYSLRICGTGFVAHGWPGSTTPGDRWRWQVWPTDHDVAPRRLRAWQPSGR